MACLLGALGAALRSRSGLIVAVGAVGMAAAWATRVEDPPAGMLDPGRPVALTGRLTGPWSRGPHGWSAPLRAETVRSGSRVERWRQKVLVSVPRRPAAGSRWHLTGYLRRSRGFANLGGAEPGPWRLRVKSLELARRDGPDHFIVSLSHALREAIELTFARFPASSPGVRLARALILGDRGWLAVDVRRALRRSGLAHLLAVSGLHVGILLTIGAAVGRLLPRRLSWVPPAAAAVLYLLVVGPRPALLRAALMAMLAAAALRAERTPQSLHSLALAAALLVALDPGAMSDLGFRLTVAATAGIVCSGRLLGERWTRLGGAAGRWLAASVCAQLFCLPWTLPAFHLLPLAAPLLNLVAIPWTSAALLGCLVWTALAAAAPTAAGALLPGLDALAWPFGAIAELPPFPGVVLPLTLSSGAGLLLAAALLALLRHPGRLAPIAVVAVVASAAVCGVDGGAETEVSLVDVGQGESVLIREGRRAILIDGGGWAAADLGGRVLLPLLARLGIRRLAAVVLTHPDVDHCGGLVDIAAYVPVAEVWTAPGWRGSPCANRVLSLPGVRWRPLWRGRQARFGSWRLRTLHPPAGDRTSGNNRSLVLRASAHGRAVLLTGDAEAATERLLARRGGVGCEVLKVAHHGSATSTTPELLAAASPRLALISAGRDNPYGHPSPRVLGRLAAAGIPVLRTDLHGQIRLPFGPRAPRRAAAGRPAQLVGE